MLACMLAVGVLNGCGNSETTADITEEIANMQKEISVENTEANNGDEVITEFGKKWKSEIVKENNETDNFSKEERWNYTMENEVLPAYRNYVDMNIAGGIDGIEYSINDGTAEMIHFGTYNGLEGANYAIDEVACSAEEYDEFFDDLGMKFGFENSADSINGAFENIAL